MQENVPPVIAAIDIGSNSIRLLVGRYEDGLVQTLDEHKEHLGLANYLDGSKDSQNIVTQLLFSSLRRMFAIAAAYQPKYRLIATHAVRKMPFHQELATKVYEEFGHPLEVIDGIEEARLASIGMETSLHLENDCFLGIDIGGGSTEIILKDSGKVLFCASISCGALTLSRDFLDYSDYTTAKQQSLENEIVRSFAPVVADISKLKLRKQPIFVVASGTGKAMANVYLTLSDNPHPTGDLNAFKIPTEATEKVCKALIQAGSADEIANIYPLDENRSKLILAGASIVDGLGKMLMTDHWVVSSFGVRQGTLIDASLRSTQPYRLDLLEKIKTVAHRCGVDLQHASRIQELACSIFEQLEQVSPSQTDCHWTQRPIEVLKMAATLHEIGRFIGFPKFHRHSYYLIYNMRLTGLSQQDRQLVALVAKHHRKSIAKAGKQETLGLDLSDLIWVNRLAAVLRLTTSICRTREDSILAISVHQTATELEFHFQFALDRHPEVCLIQSRMEVPNLEKALGKKVRIHCLNPELRDS